MCGRTACTLDPGEVRRACTYRDGNGKRRQPTWRDAPGGKQYYPSHNVAPGSYTPVMLSHRHFQGSGEVTVGRVLMPMQWGLVPSWHKGDPKSVMYNMNNCRSDGMLQKKSFKGPLEKGRRCVVLADGFFEWKRDKSEKQPYYIYFPQPSSKKLEGEKCDINVDLKTEVKGEVKSEVEVEVKPDVKVEVKPEVKDEVKSDQAQSGVKLEVKGENDQGIKKEFEEDKDDNVKVEEDCGEGCDNGSSCHEEEWQGPRLLTMAGVFDVWKPAESAEPLYSYSIITVDASPAMAWIHDRMPALLINEEEIEQWLEYGEVPLKKAVEVIRPVECVQTHPVSTIVNNSRNKSPDCVRPIDLTKKSKPSASSSFMMNWLAKGKKESPVKKSDDGPPEKKLKMEQA
ncbi:abasic site processing protein HMCES-like [Liolophura sinensis]|uniref:abasic site processing protein HMCES-like n=1 Tax=Liolophura sinensis TaxID=3198878 RepID=UPI003158C348